MDKSNNSLKMCDCPMFESCNFNCAHLIKQKNMLDDSSELTSEHGLSNTCGINTKFSLKNLELHISLFCLFMKLQSTKGVDVYHIDIWILDMY